MSQPIDIRPDHLQIVQDILNAHIPNHTVWVFGSRAKWTTKDSSDLDLCIKGEEPLSPETLAHLRDAFSESNLPYKVDVVDWYGISDSFRKIIENEKIVLPRTEHLKWQKIRLGDACIKIGSGATPRGGKDSYQDSGEIVLIRSQNIYNEGFKSEGLVYINKDQAKKLDNVSIKKDDVLLNITGDSVARVCLAPKEYISARVNQHVAIIRPDPKKLNAKFLRYYLCSPKMQDFMLGLAASGATRNALTKNMIESFTLICPDLENQEKIAEILSSLDDKIELNRQMNETLEATARALFKSWFIDFDPVRAKMTGRQPEGLSADLAALFPDALIDDKPKGWKQESLYSCAEYINGAAFKNMHFSNNENALPVIKIAELKNGIGQGTKFTNTNLGNRYLINTGEILFSWSGSPETSIDTFLWVGGSAWLNQHIFKVVTKSPERRTFAFFLLKHLKPLFIATAKDKQTTGLGHITVQDFKRLKFTYPSQEVLKAFSEIATPILNTIQNYLIQIALLSNFRDSLLPKLISGELRVSNPDEAENG